MKPYTPLFKLLWVGLCLSVPALAQEQQCVEDVLCVVAMEQQHEVAFYVDNLSADDLTLIFAVDMENMVASVAFPYQATFPGRRRTLAFTLRVDQARAGWRYSYRFTWRKAVTERRSCIEDLFCVVTEERDEGVQVYVDNLRPFDVTILLEMKTENGIPDAPLPYVGSFPGSRRTRAFNLRRVDPWQGIGYQYAYQWHVGRLDARHDDTFAYALPYAPGKTFDVGQGFDGPTTHRGIHAIDFDLPERTPIHAARAGVVAHCVDQFEAGGTEERFKEQANVILIQHDDGTVGSYVHLARNGVFVNVGQRVAQGQVIGVSGNTGYSSGPHLHFEVFSVTKDLGRRTLPVRFNLGAGRVATLEAGKAYTAPQ